MGFSATSRDTNAAAAGLFPKTTFVNSVAYGGPRAKVSDAPRTRRD